MDSQGILGLINNEEVLRAIINTSATRTQSTLHNSLCDIVQSQVRDTFENAKNKPKIDLKRVLTQEQLQLVCDLFPERHITTSARERSSHSMAAVLRVLEQDYLLNMFPKQSLVYDIGGNWWVAANRYSDRKIHCCCPILDYRDSQRKARRWAFMKKAVSDQEMVKPGLGERIKKLTEDEKAISFNVQRGFLDPAALNGQWYCQNRFEDCVFKHTGDAYAMAIHSIYDIKLHDLVDSLADKGVKYMMGSFLFSVDLLLGKKRGELSTVEGFFEVEGESVKYCFYDDPNCGYKHRLADLLQYLTKTFVEASNGCVYYLELTEMRGDIMFFSLTDATEARLMGVLDDSSFKCIPIDSRGKVIFPLFDIDKRTGELCFSEAVLPKDFVSRAIEYVSRVKDNQLTADTINSYLASTNNSVVIGGSARKTVEKVNPVLIPSITTTLMVYSELQRSKQKNILSKLRSQTKERLEMKELLKFSFLRVFGKDSLYQRALQTFANWVTYVHGAEILDFENVPMYVEITDRVKFWRKRAAYEGFSVDLADLDVKIKRYKDNEAEKRMVSEAIVFEKTGLTAPLRDELEKPADYISRDAASGLIYAPFIDEWLSSDSHFSLKKTEGVDKLGWLRNGFSKLIGAEMDFSDIYVDRFSPTSSVTASTPVASSAASTSSDCSEDVSHTSFVSCNTPTALAGVVPFTVAETFTVVTSSPEKSPFGEKPSLVVSPNDSVENSDILFPFVKSAVTCPVIVTSLPIVEASVEMPMSEMVEEVLKPAQAVIMSDSEAEDLKVTAQPVGKKSWATEAEEEDGRLTGSESDTPTALFPAFISNQVAYTRLPPEPIYLETDNRQMRAKKEFVWYLQCKMTSDKSTLMNIIGDFVSNMYHHSSCSTPKDSCFIDLSNGSRGSWFNGKRPTRLGHAFGVHFLLDGDLPFPECVKNCKLLPLAWERDKNGKFVSEFPTLSRLTGGYLLLNDLTFLMNEMAIYKNLVCFMGKASRNKPCRVTLIDGIPGCGKSTWIIEHANLKREVVLSMGKEATLDLRSRFENEKKCLPQELERVRTVDSYLMHDAGKRMRTSVIHFDEALMAHAGMVYFCAEMMSARRVVCQGDSKQIPFINRVESITLKYSQLHVDETEKKRLTYRSPLDVVHLLQKKGYYGNDPLTSANPTVRSLATIGPRDAKPMTSVYTVPKIGGCQYLTFTQAEKEDVQKFLGKGHWDVNTVHEAQGKTYNDVILVRLKTTENEIYPGGRKSEPYIVVGTTRHRRSMVYYTAIEDRLYCDIQDLQHIMEDKLMKHLHSEGVK